MIHIYYGFGKGKTSNLNGIALRAKGARLKPLIVRFLKVFPSNEDKALEFIRIDVISTFSQKNFIKFMNEEEKKIAYEDTRKALNFVKANCENYDVILLDEFLDLVETEMATEEELLEVLKSIPKEKEVLISGHYKLEKIFEIADLITHFKNERHYFEKGIEARDGIDK